MDWSSRTGCRARGCCTPTSTTSSRRTIGAQHWACARLEDRFSRKHDALCCAVGKMYWFSWSCVGQGQTECDACIHRCSMDRMFPYPTFLHGATLDVNKDGLLAGDCHCCHWLRCHWRCRWWLNRTRLFACQKWFWRALSALTTR